jgi:hypothetical protein
MQPEKVTPEAKLALYQSGIDDFRSKVEKLHARLKAPKGRYRLVVVDAFEDPFEGAAVIGDFESLEEAREVQSKYVQDYINGRNYYRYPPAKGIIPVKYYIYDEDGKFLE